MRVKLMLVWLMMITIGAVMSCSKDEINLEPKIKLNPSNFDITVKNKGFDFVEIEWTTSYISDESKIVYDVYINDELKGKDLTNLNYRFEQLDAATSYNLKVIAKSIYETQVVASCSVTTSDTPTPKAVNLKKEEVSSDFLKVSWENSDPTQELTYAIYLNGVLKDENLNVSTYTFSKLEGNQLYHIKLIGRNRFNKTVESTLDLTTNDYAEPNDFSLSVESVSLDGAKIVWSSSEKEKLAYRVLLNGVEQANGVEVLEYEFKSLNFNKRYTAEVEAVNEHGKVKRKAVEFATLDADGPADFSISAENITHDSALIRWKTTGDKSVVLSYKVFVNGIFEGEDFNDNYLLLDKLEAGKRYLVKIEAKNAYGKTLAKTTEFTTLDAVVLSDFSVSANDIKPTSALLTWTESVASDGSKVTYDVYYGNGAIAKRGLDTRQYQLDGLQAGKLYTYKVEAKCNSVLLGLPKTVAFTTINHEIPGDFQLQVQDITTTQATVTWTNSVLPSGGAVAYGAYLNDLAYTYDATGNAYTFKNLKPGTKYTAKIVAKSQNNTTNEKIISFTTELEPEPEVSINVVNVGPRLLELSWNLTGNPYFDSYELFLDNNSIKSGYVKAYTFRELQSNTAHKVKVVAKRGDKSYVKEIDVKTLAYAQAADFELHVMPKTYSLVEVDLKDFHEKNKNRIEDFAEMTYELYLNGGKVALEKNMITKSLSNLKEMTPYSIQVIVKYADGSIAVDKRSSFTTPANEAPVWNNDLKIKQVGFSFLELENNSATDADDSHLVYTYYVNGKALQTNIGYIGNQRGNGQIERGVNSNNEPIFISHLESNTEYSVFIEARDPLGKVGRSNTVNFRTSIDAKETFNIIAAIEPELKRVGPRWAKMGNVSSIKEIRINWVVDGVKMPRGQYIAPSKLMEIGNDHSLLLDYSPFFVKNPNASLSFTVSIVWIDKEALGQSESSQIVIKE